MKSAIMMGSSVFVGAMVCALQANPEVFFSLATLKAAIPGALLAGLVAVTHLYQPSPAQSIVTVRGPAQP